MVSTEGLLTVDCGNSTVDCLDHVSGARLRIDSSAADFDALAEWLRGRPLTRCVVATVVSAVGRDVHHTLSRCLPLVERAGVDLPCPLSVDYPAPHTLGVDRWLGALAAHRRYGSAVVIDCGSATTVNLVSASGAFRGGCIAPGLRAFVAGMAAVTPALPPPNLQSEPRVPATDTQGAVDAGVLLGYCGLMERLAADSLRVMGAARLVITGGHAETVRRRTRLQADFVSDLVHQGLRLLAEGPR